MQPTEDLRQAWNLSATAFRPAGDEGADGAIPPQDPGAPLPPADGGTDDALDDDGDVKDPDKKKLSDQAARYRMAAKAERERADTAQAALTAANESVRALRLHNAFLLAAAGQVNDLDAAWKLADVSSVNVSDDGTVLNLADLIAATVERYPYLCDASPAEPFQPLPLPVASGRPTGRRAAASTSTQSILEGKFPALKSRR